MEDKAEANLNINGTNYRLQVSIRQACSFNVSLFDDDKPDRWTGDFAAEFIERMTRQAGSYKPVQTFWKMLQYAISEASDEVVLSILTEGDVGRLRPGSQSSSTMFTSVENMYLIIEHRTTFGQAKYPLKLKRQPYSNEELCAMIRALKSENRKLLNNQSQASQTELVHSLEAQICDLNKIMKRLASEKDETIHELKQKIAELEKAQTKRNKAANAPVGRLARKQETAAKPRQPVRTTATTTRRNNSVGKSTDRKPVASRPGAVPRTRYSGVSSGTGSARSSARSSATGSARSSAAGSRKSSAVGSARSSAAGSRNSSAQHSARSSSRCSNGSFKRFDPTEWVRNRQSGNSSRNSSRGASPASRTKKQTPMRSGSGSGSVLRSSGAFADDMSRIRARIQQKYRY